MTRMEFLEILMTKLGDYYAVCDEDCAPGPVETADKFSEQLRGYCENRDITSVITANHIDEKGYGKDTTIIIRLTDKSGDGE